MRTIIILILLVTMLISLSALLSSLDKNKDPSERIIFENSERRLEELAIKYGWEPIEGGYAMDKSDIDDGSDFSGDGGLFLELDPEIADKTDSGGSQK